MTCEDMLRQALEIIANQRAVIEQQHETIAFYTRSMTEKQRKEKAREWQRRKRRLLRGNLPKGANANQSLSTKTNV